VKPPKEGGFFVNCNSDIIYLQASTTKLPETTSYILFLPELKVAVSTACKKTKELFLVFALFKNTKKLVGIEKVLLCPK
jgi:hypothetical protein